MNAAAKKGLPSPTERPDLYDSFDGLQHASDRKNPVAVPSRLQALIAERQAKAGPEKLQRKPRWKLPVKTATEKSIETPSRKKVAKTTTKRETRPKVAAVG